MNKSQIVAAVNALIAESQYAKRVRMIYDLIEEWDDAPRIFAGKLAVLNPLVDIGLDDIGKLERLLKLAESKRRLLPQIRRVDYQRELMQEKRSRLAKAVQLEQMVRGVAMKPAEKKRYREAMQSGWMAKRDAFIAAKGVLSWKDRNAATQEFWASIDAELDRSLVEAQAVLNHAPVKRSRRVVNGKCAKKGDQGAA